ncbi:TPA: SprT family protein [Bacillus pseudomycoides]|nr:SprT family protein [Bacillus pseudomycoides]
MRVNEIYIQGLVEEVSIKYFVRPFLHKAMFNKRLRTTGGRYILNTHNIELNYHYYVAYGEKELIEVIKHELCHYHLHIMGKGYRHRDQDFRELLKQVNAPRFCKRMTGRQVEIKQYVYECITCHFQYVRKRKVNTIRYVCGKCKGELKRV